MKLVTNPGFLVAYTEADENRREREARTKQKNIEEVPTDTPSTNTG